MTPTFCYSMSQPPVLSSLLHFLSDAPVYHCSTTRPPLLTDVQATTHHQDNLCSMLVRLIGLPTKIHQQPSCYSMAWLLVLTTARFKGKGNAFVLHWLIFVALLFLFRHLIAKQALILLPSLAALNQIQKTQPTRQTHILSSLFSSWTQMLTKCWLIQLRCRAASFTRWVGSWIFKMEEATHKRNAVANLTDHVLVEILYRIAAHSLCCCKCVCRSWSHLISDSDYHKELP